MGPGDLARALCGLAFRSHPNLLVGTENSDDAGIYKITDEIALVQTVDFFTPITDDPYLFGQIAAANALSDVYAMGAEPVCAMNMACFPVKELDISILHRTLEGGLDKVHEAGAVLVGGHSVEDKEFKYGLSVTGLVHPDRFLSNRGARPGDVLVLTKKLGTGIAATALKADLAPADVQHAVERSMATLNRAAAESLRGLPVHACTDVTGFGLIGHLLEMIEGSDVGAVLAAAELPVFDGVRQMCDMGLLPGGLHRNRVFREGLVDMDPGVPRHLQDLLYDPQTSGGLLVALPRTASQKLIAGLHACGVDAATVVGEITDRHPGRVVVR